MKPLPPKFSQIDRLGSPSDVISNPEEKWLTVLEAPCTFPVDIFERIMLDLIKNPNLTSSHLFRADIFYDSGQDTGCDEQVNLPSPSAALLAQLRSEYRPRCCHFPDLHCRQTIVRELIPRNPQLDRPLIQTCQLFQTGSETEEQNLIVYIPHVECVEDIPFYHPAVKKLAFLHRWKTAVDPPGTISISYLPFDSSDTTPLSDKLQRTALRLLQTVHRHGQGQLAGYEKRVHLDRVIPQKRHQDTYTRLKSKYAKQLTENWVEVTDPVKHVFEDLGIAAFLIELWRDLYSVPDPRSKPTVDRLPPFPGFVDIGCGNGLLVSILLSEGYPGWGFDARERKTWSIFPSHIRSHLKQMLLVPRILTDSLPQQGLSSLGDHNGQIPWHDGIFPGNAFIISNHADELTAWTPLLAALNGSAFIAIPCCSHDLSGARFRAPPVTKGIKLKNIDYKTATNVTKEDVNHFPDHKTSSNETEMAQKSNTLQIKTKQAAETGSLQRSEAQLTKTSAFATLCSYVMSLTEEMGFVAESEVLRIPSTRNECILARSILNGQAASHLTHKGGNDAWVRAVLERELGRAVDVVAKEWVERVQKLTRKPPSGH